MKHFSFAMFGFASDEEIAAEDAAREERQWAAACRKYARYLKRIAPSCPPGVQKFIPLNPHDARFLAASKSRDAGRFACTLGCSAVTQPSPRQVTLIFEGIENWVGPTPALGDAWLYDEFERLDADTFRLTGVLWRKRARRANRRKLSEWLFSNMQCYVDLGDADRSAAG